MRDLRTDVWMWHWFSAVQSEQNASPSQPTAACSNEAVSASQHSHSLQTQTANQTQLIYRLVSFAGLNYTSKWLPVDVVFWILLETPKCIREATFIRATVCFFWTQVLQPYWKLLVFSVRFNLCWRNDACGGLRCNIGSIIRF